MKASHKAASTDQPVGLKQRARASRRSAERALQPAANQAREPVATACAAAMLGELLDKAWSELLKVDDVTTPENVSVLEPLERHFRHRIGELESAVSYARAASPSGMLTQIAVAFDALDRATTSSDKVLREAANSRAERCLYSVAAALCAMTGIDRESSCAGRYMSTANDKFASLSLEVAR